MGAVGAPAGVLGAVAAAALAAQVPVGGRPLGVGHLVVDVARGGLSAAADPHAALVAELDQALHADAGVVLVGSDVRQDCRSQQREQPVTADLHRRRFGERCGRGAGRGAGDPDRGMNQGIKTEGHTVARVDVDAADQQPAAAAG